MKRSRIKAEIIKKLNSSETLVGMVADKLHMKTAGIKSAINRESQQMCLPHFQAAIKEVLGLPADEVITEIDTASPELSNHE